MQIAQNQKQKNKKPSANIKNDYYIHLPLLPSLLNTFIAPSSPQEREAQNPKS